MMTHGNKNKVWTIEEIIRQRILDHNFKVGQEFVLFDNEVKEALALYKHLKNHPEVKNASVKPGEPMCKICNKTAKQILKELEAKMAQEKKISKKEQCLIIFIIAGVLSGAAFTIAIVASGMVFGAGV